jgi:predicted aspartyl protease
VDHPHAPHGHVILSPSKLALTLGLVIASCVPAVAATTCTNVQLVGRAGGLVAVPVKVNGKGPFRFVVDTGSTAAIVSTTLARRLDLRSVGTNALGAGGRFTARATVADTMQVAGTARRDVLIGITDLTPLSNAARERIDGLLGYTFLKPYRMTIDYPKHRLCLEATGSG